MPSFPAPSTRQPRRSRKLAATRCRSSATFAVEAAVYAAIDAAVKRFGVVDILVNNASAISLTGTLDTPMKRFDLMNDVDVRRTFLCSQACIPHLKRAAAAQRHAHILTLAPPLNLDPKWFAKHVAYTIACELFLVDSISAASARNISHRERRMNHQVMRARAYLKDGCPYSFKYLLFMTEAALLDRIEVIRCDPGSADFAATKQMLAAATGKAVTFPTVEVEPGRYLSDSDRLIDYYAQAANVSPTDLPTFIFYEKTIFPQLDALHREHTIK